jgi:hypothetical protein
MAMSDAEALIRRHITVGSVFEGTVGDGNAYRRGMGPVRIFVNADKTEQVVLLDRSTGKVLAIRRTVAVPEAPSDAQLLEALRAKYGEPSVVGGTTNYPDWEWGGPKFPCSALHVDMASTTQVEGPPQGGSMAISRPLDSRVGLEYGGPPAQPPPNLQQLAQCQARLEVSRSQLQMSEMVYDPRIFAAQLADATAKAASETKPPRL